VIGSSQGHVTDKHSFPQRGSNPKCQQSSGIRPTPYPHGQRDRPFIRMIQNIFKPPLPTSLWTKKLKFPKQITLWRHSPRTDYTDGATAADRRSSANF
jgi:hypothetical protein